MNHTLTPRAEAIGNELLKIHRERCSELRGKKPEEISEAVVKETIVQYKNLFERSGVPFPGENCGPPLLELAVWCVEHRYPPLHALAVRRDSGIPGYNYDGSPGWPDRCSLDNWHNEVRYCIAFSDYRDKI